MSDTLFMFPPAGWAAVRQEVEAVREKHVPALPTADAVRWFLDNIRMPRDVSWALKSVDKAGSSSCLRFLFELQFGVPLTVAADAAWDINPDAVSHLTFEAGVFRRPFDFEGGTTALFETSLRLATVRHPSTRALSAFLYLCKSQELQSTWFVNERLRLSALTGFDWTRHSRTPDGFVRFLDYVAASAEAARNGGLSVNSHWRAQWDLIRPGLFRPDLIGRTETLADFFIEIAARLGRPLPENWVAPHTNRQGYDSTDSFLGYPGVSDRLLALYRQDYEGFGYEL